MIDPQKLTLAFHLDEKNWTHNNTEVRFTVFLCIITIYDLHDPRYFEKFPVFQHIWEGVQNTVQIY